MRLLVVGGTSLMTWVVRHLVPENVEVEHAMTLDEVSTILRLRSPQAALFSGSPASRPWDEVHRLCQEHEPPIPTLFHPCVDLDRDEMALSDYADDYCPRPLPACELRREIHRLLGVEEEQPADVDPPPEETAEVACAVGAGTH